jgi:hypothetical protein
MNERSVVREAFAVRLKLVTLELAELLASDAKAYREFEVLRYRLSVLNTRQYNGPLVARVHPPGGSAFLPPS